jgi:hypothetical protein|tara:strand:+ start:29 stop:706 length:678 start_codon:yes stop_codon:yes gene_type:complete
MNSVIEFITTGPQIMKTKVSMDLVDLLLKKGEESTKNNLVANDVSSKKQPHQMTIKKEFGFKDIDSWFSPLIQPHISDYINWSIERQGVKLNPGYDELPSSLSTSMINLWINYQEKGEYNPPHRHSGSLSFAIWLQIPEEIKNEPLLPGNQTPGSFVIRYGEQQQFSTYAYHFLPEVGDILIFPSYCEHYVHQFKSDVTRISVSGNLVVNMAYDEKTKEEVYVGL